MKLLLLFLISISSAIASMDIEMKDGEEQRSPEYTKWEIGQTHSPLPGHPFIEISNPKNLTPPWKEISAQLPQNLEGLKLNWRRHSLISVTPDFIDFLNSLSAPIRESIIKDNFSLAQPIIDHLPNYTQQSEHALVDYYEQYMNEEAYYHNMLTRVLKFLHAYVSKFKNKAVGGGDENFQKKKEIHEDHFLIAGDFFPNKISDSTQLMIDPTKGSATCESYLQSVYLFKDNQRVGQFSLSFNTYTKFQATTAYCALVNLYTICKYTDTRLSLKDVIKPL